jgi:2,4-dienoyl-CoA reductase-like NADH-dependent reductase (Old Yellow Enzyme family)
MKATAAVPEDRISPEDVGLWADSQITLLKMIFSFSQTQAAMIGIQLAHAGRKVREASTLSMSVESNADSSRRADTSLHLPTKTDGQSDGKLLFKKNPPCSFLCAT